MTDELETLRDWLVAEQVYACRHGEHRVYWRPIYAVLEGTLRADRRQCPAYQNVPGCKTDIKDAEWIAELVCCGLIRPSFVPPKPLRELRELLRYRRKLMEVQAAERNRLQRLLESANIKLGSVATDVFGVSGRAMLRALIEGRPRLWRWLSWRSGRLRRKRGELTMRPGRAAGQHAAVPAGRCSCAGSKASKR